MMGKNNPQNWHFIMNQVVPNSTNIITSPTAMHWQQEKMPILLKNVFVSKNINCTKSPPLRAHLLNGGEMRSMHKILLSYAVFKVIQ